MGLCGSDPPPDPAKGYAAGVSADLESLPARRLIEALAVLGEAGFVDMPGKSKDKVYDFTGLGAADYAGAYGDQMAQQMLDLQRELGPQFVEQRLAELAQSDPEGAAMRTRLWESVKSGVEAGPTDRPGNQELADLIQSRLDRGGTLDPSLEHEISQSVLGKQTAMGNYLGNAAASEEARVLGQASDAQAADAQAQALAFLTGGLDPQDVAQRESQQNLANLGAFLAGETPQAQFSQLSGAQGGAAPFAMSGPLAGVNQNAGWQGIGNQMQAWDIGQQAANSTVNPWIAGLSGAAGGLNLWASWNGGGAGAGAGAV